jgi:riboflavin kinase/FMN adenylyltransferase
MRVFTKIEDIDLGEQTAVALGNFDGVHLGHAELILRTVSYARAHGLKSAVFTFANHPQNYILGRNIVKNITTPEGKIALIEKFGVDYLFSLRFDEKFHDMSPASFLHDLVLGSFRAAAVACGFNFHFGRDAAGDTTLLAEAAAREKFHLEILGPVVIDGVVVSSTVIRELITAGHVEQCPKFLGRRFAVCGEVIHGNENGRKMGFPTANVALREEMVIPSNGVYATRTSVEYGPAIPSVTNIGDRPTIGDGKMLAESNLFDFDEDIYGKRIRIEFIEKIRSEIQFSGLKELGAQIARDKNTAAKILAFR